MLRTLFLMIGGGRGARLAGPKLAALLTTPGIRMARFHRTELPAALHVKQGNEQRHQQQTWETGERWYLENGNNKTILAAHRQLFLDMDPAAFPALLDYLKGGGVAAAPPVQGDVRGASVGEMLGTILARATINLLLMPPFFLPPLPPPVRQPSSGAVVPPAGIPHPVVVGTSAESGQADELIAVNAGGRVWFLPKALLCNRRGWPLFGQSLGVAHPITNAPAAHTRLLLTRTDPGRSVDLTVPKSAPGSQALTVLNPARTSLQLRPVPGEKKVVEVKKDAGLQAWEITVTNFIVTQLKPVMDDASKLGFFRATVRFGTEAERLRTANLLGVNWQLDKGTVPRDIYG